MNSEFLDRTKIAPDFNPLGQALWSPTEEALKHLERQVSDGMAESSLPAAVKDAVADSSYNRAKPYYQGIAQFIQRSSLPQMMLAIRGAARALRNSDYVSPEAKTALLDEVLVSWVRICQILVVLSPALAAERSATFEGMSFVLAKGFNQETPQQRWEKIMTCIADNVVSWFQDDLFSKKMGALLANYTQGNQQSLGELLVLLVMIRQRPPGWEKEVEKFIVRERKNSFYLGRVFQALWSEWRISFSTERTRQQLRRLAAMSIAKHTTGAKHPNTKLIQRAVEALETKKQ